VRPEWLLAGLIAASWLIRYLANRGVDGLWIMPDEAIYGELGRSLYERGRLAILDGPQVPYSLVYPAIIGLPLTVGGLAHGYTLVKVLQPAVMSLVAVPVYLWARTLMPRNWALLAAALSLAVPGLLYSGLLMSHVAAYPITVLAVWASARALERRTATNQLLAAGAILLAIATRLQAVVLVPALATAIVVKAALERKPRAVLRYAPAGLSLATPAVLWLGWRVVHGGHWSGGLGPYAAAGTQSYDLGDVFRFVGYHFGAITLVTGVLPVCAVALLAVDAALGRERSAAVRAFVAITVSYAGWELAEVGAFASENAGRLLERDIMTLAPPLFVGFALWLSRGAPRTWLRASVVALVVLVPLVTTPFTDLVGPAALPDSFSLAPLHDLLQRDPSVDLTAVVSICAAAVAAIFALLPRRFAALLPALVAVWLVGASISATREVSARVRQENVELLGGDRRWIDETAAGDAAFLYGGETYWNGVWQNVFWNERLRRVYDLPETEVPGPLPQTTLTPEPNGVLRRPDGRAVDDSRFVVATAEHTFVGEPVRTLVQQGIDSRGWTLWRIDDPLRLSTELTGVKPNGDILEPAKLVVYDCRGGRVLLTLLPKSSPIVRVLVNGRLVRTLEFHGEPSWSGRFPFRSSRDPRVCTFELQPSGLLGSTVFLYER
jgi:hypothetical protein